MVQFLQANPSFTQGCPETRCLQYPLFPSLLKFQHSFFGALFLLVSLSSQLRGSPISTLPSGFTYPGRWSGWLLTWGHSLPDIPLGFVWLDPGYSRVLLPVLLQCPLLLPRQTLSPYQRSLFKLLGLFLWVNQHRPSEYMLSGPGVQPFPSPELLSVC